MQYVELWHAQLVDSLTTAYGAELDWHLFCTICQSSFMAGSPLCCLKCTCNMLGSGMRLLNAAQEKETILPSFGCQTMRDGH